MGRSIQKAKMEGETFEYNGKDHISERNGGIYFVNREWTVHLLAEELWKKHHKALKWREYGSGEFYAFIEKDGNYATGRLDACDTMFVNALLVGQTTRSVSHEVNKEIVETVAKILVEE